MSNHSICVAIIGAGIGGLVPAQLLHDDSRFEVTVYERSGSDGGRNHLAGLRICLSQKLRTALQSKLPSAAVALLEKAIGESHTLANGIHILRKH
jgi:2-polyprenyl-6-methoxyphenol hydroxylase-like FAD-dependent oxidoreductase